MFIIIGIIEITVLLGPVDHSPFAPLPPCISVTDIYKIRRQYQYNSHRYPRGGRGLRDRAVVRPEPSNLHRLVRGAVGALTTRPPDPQGGGGLLWLLGLS